MNMRRKQITFSVAGRQSDLWGDLQESISNATMFFFFNLSLVIPTPINTPLNMIKNHFNFK